MATTSKGAPYPVGTEPVRDGDNAIQALAEWASNDFIRSGRVDRAIEGNGYLRLTNTEVFFAGVKPSAIHGTGINLTFAIVTWDGTADGGGALLKVYSDAGVVAGPGAFVAVYYSAFR